MFREKVYGMEWDRAKDVPNGDRVDQGAIVEVQHHIREIMAATTRLQALYRKRTINGQR